MRNFPVHGNFWNGSSEPFFVVALPGGGCTPCQNAIRDEDKGIFSFGSLREKIDTVSAVPLAVQGRVCPQGLGLCGPRCPRCPRCPPNRLRHRCLALLPQVVAQTSGGSTHRTPLTTRMPRPLRASPCTAEYVHTWLKAPYPVRFVKLSNHRLS